MFYKRGVLKNFTGIFLWILCNFSKSGNKIWSVNLRNIFLEKSCWKCGWGTSFRPLSAFLKNFTKYKSKWLKLQVSRNWNSIQAQIFSCEFHTFFPKTLFTEHFWMTASADSSILTKVYLSHFYDHTFFIFSFMFSLLLLTQLVRGFQPPFF